MIYDWRANSLMANIAVSISCCSAYPFRIFSRTKTDFLYSAIDALPFTFRIRFLGCIQLPLTSMRRTLTATPWEGRRLKWSIVCVRYKLHQFFVFVPKPYTFISICLYFVFFIALILNYLIAYLFYFQRSFPVLVEWKFIQKLEQSEYWPLPVWSFVRFYSM